MAIMQILAVAPRGCQGFEKALSAHPFIAETPWILFSNTTKSVPQPTDPGFSESGLFRSRRWKQSGRDRLLPADEPPQSHRCEKDEILKLKAPATGRRLQYRG